MAIIAIIAGCVWCLAAILGPLIVVNRFQANRTRVGRLAPIFGFMVGLAGLVLIIGCVQQKVGVRDGKEHTISAQHECRELTFSGWSAWRSCKPLTD